MFIVDLIKACCHDLWFFLKRTYYRLPFVNAPVSDTEKRFPLTPFFTEEFIYPCYDKFSLEAKHAIGYSVREFEAYINIFLHHLIIMNINEGANLNPINDKDKYFSMLDDTYAIAEELRLTMCLLAEYNDLFLVDRIKELMADLSNSIIAFEQYWGVEHKGRSVIEDEDEYRKFYARLDKKFPNAAVY